MNAIAFVVSVRHANGHFVKYVVCASHSFDAEQFVLARVRDVEGAYVAWTRSMSDGDLYEITEK